jgi:hypothetical protein
VKPENIKKMVMNKKYFIERTLLVVLGLSVLFSSLSFGMNPAGEGTEGDLVQRPKVSGVIRGGVATLTTVDSGSAFWYGGGFLIRTSKKIALEILVDRYSLEVREDLGGLGTGKLNVTPALLSGQWRFIQGTFEPYLALGVGFYFMDYIPDHENPEEGHDYNVTDRFALHLGGGVDIQVLRGLALFGELRYSLIKTWVQSSSDHHVAPEDQDIFKLNTLCFGVGIRYFF